MCHQRRAGEREGPCQDASHAGQSSRNVQEHSLREQPAFPSRTLQDNLPTLPVPKAGHEGNGNGYAFPAAIPQLSPHRRTAVEEKKNFCLRWGRYIFSLQTERRSLCPRHAATGAGKCPLPKARRQVLNKPSPSSRLTAPAARGHKRTMPLHHHQPEKSTPVINAPLPLSSNSATLAISPDVQGHTAGH